jgi:hypothetical protein
VTRGEIVAELRRIRARLEEWPSREAHADAYEAVGALERVVRAGALFDPDGCPFEPGTVRLVSVQSRPKGADAPPPKPRKKKKKKKAKPPAAATTARPAPPPRRDGPPLTGRIAAMVRAGVPDDQIVERYRIKPEHAAAFVAAFVEPARAEAGAQELMRCPSPS